MAESRTDDVNDMNVDCSIQNFSRGKSTLRVILADNSALSTNVDKTGEYAIEFDILLVFSLINIPSINLLVSEPRNCYLNMAAPIEVPNNVESLFVANMYQNSQMIKTLPDNLANLQRQLLTNKTSTLDHTKKVVNSSPEPKQSSRSANNSLVSISPSSSSSSCSPSKFGDIWTGELKIKT
jgi:hypothetical protein